MKYAPSRASINIVRRSRHNPLDSNDDGKGSGNEWMFTKVFKSFWRKIVSSDDEECPATLPSLNTSHVDIKNDDQTYDGLQQLPTLPQPFRHSSDADLEPVSLSDDALQQKVQEIVSISEHPKTKKQPEQLPRDTNGVLKSLNDHSNAAVLVGSGSGSTKKRARQSNEYDNKDQKRLKRYHHHHHHRYFAPQPCIHRVLDQGIAIVRDCSLTTNSKTETETRKNVLRTRSSDVIDVSDVSSAVNEDLNGRDSDDSSQQSQSTLFKYFRVEHPKNAQTYPHFAASRLTHDNEIDDSECKELQTMNDDDNDKQCTLLAYYKPDTNATNGKKRSYSNIRETAVQTHGDGVQQQEAECVDVTPPRKRLRRIEVELTPFVSLRNHASSASPASPASSQHSECGTTGASNNNMSHLTKVLHMRKTKYIECYKQRFTRIFGTHKPANVAKVDDWLKLYGDDVNKLHLLYTKVCRKYQLSPLPLYEGQGDACDDDATEQAATVSISCSREASLMATAQHLDINVSDEPQVQVVVQAQLQQHDYDDDGDDQNHNGADAESVASVSTFATPKSEHETHSMMRFAPPSQLQNEDWTMTFSDSMYTQNGFTFDSDQYNVFDAAASQSQSQSQQSEQTSFVAHHHNCNQHAQQQQPQQQQVSESETYVPINFQIPTNFEFDHRFDHRFDTHQQPPAPPPQPMPQSQFSFNHEEHGHGHEHERQTSLQPINVQSFFNSSKSNHTNAKSKRPVILAKRRLKK